MPVNFKKWVKKSEDRIRTDPVMGIPRSFYYAYVASLLTVSKRYSIGTNVFEEDWDLLIILDACRVDAIREVANDYEYIASVDSIWSVGSTSFEWLPLTFQRTNLDEIRKTAYVTGNPYTEPVFRNKKEPPVSQPIPFGPKNYDVVEPTDFAYLDEVWRYGVDNENNVVLPRTMTDRAIDIHRSKNPDKMIIHYIQPHEPHLGEEHGLGSNVFVDLRKGIISKSEAWKSYVENLKLILDELNLLLENIDAERVVISADHGEAFGEFGFYAHQIGCPLPGVRKVPWIETTAKDENTHEPQTKRNLSSRRELEVDEHLAHLGYL